MFKIASIAALLLASWTITVDHSNLMIDTQSGQIQLEPAPILSLTDKFDQAVNRWIAELAKDPEFADWSKAQWRREPLGPGQHGWVVILSKNGADCGYLVISIDPSGNFLLSEYGTGSFPLFGIDTLYQSLVQRGLIPSISGSQFKQDTAILRKPLYYSPFQSVWSVAIDGDDYWVDGKTGELLPLDSSVIDQMNEKSAAWPGMQNANTLQVELKLNRSKVLPAFNAYYDLSWINNPQNKIKDLQSLQDFLDQEKSLICVANSFDKSVGYAFPITGYHEWSVGDSYLRIEQHGPRYVHAQTMMQEVLFYKVQNDQIPSPSNS